ncbi:biotin holocarboxylase synthetase [Physocladia obscura]|uniref:Biotin holocarboxylase synthetase n=1 Tax=Physocladia obscura TaxID=109957 RepID=A0AAD5T490_9FUNG|nr:biotin holocarboxylase synthetase [Physocladia obscura]
MNVLVYSGPGTSPRSREATLHVLKRLLGGRYDVLSVGATEFLHPDKPWKDSTALVVVPGGRDLPYVESLGPRGTAEMRSFVQQGGRYLGICAGAYFASKRVEFEPKDSVLRVVGDRALNLAPCIAKGSVTPAFSYDDETGARAVSISVSSALKNNIPQSMAVYCNGSPYFHIDQKEEHVRVSVLASYAENHAGVLTDNATNMPAIIHVEFGKGAAVLCGPHLEFASEDTKGLQLSEWNTHQGLLLASLLSLLGLAVTNSAPQPPTLESDPFTFSSLPEADISWISHFVTDSNPVKDTVNVIQFIECENFSDIGLYTTGKEIKTESAENTSNLIKILYSNSQYPNAIQDPSQKFDMTVYFSNLKSNRTSATTATTSLKESWRFGSQILYARSTGSTQTFLEKNYAFASHIPDGLVCVASHQFSGRGRGSNSWVSQDGCLQFSLALKHRDASSAVFLQYLFALAVIHGVRNLTGGDIGVRLKWPNDIYCWTNDESNKEATESSKVKKKVLKKIGGILVTSSYVDGVFDIVIGSGLNVSNKQPTLSLNDLISQHNETISSESQKIPPLSIEQVLASILTSFEEMYNKFTATEHAKFAFEPFLKSYYAAWLHSDQYVYLKEHKTSARIVGIDKSGLLNAVGVDDGNNVFGGSGQVYLLQPDGNSFDMMKGLISRKQ